MVAMTVDGSGGARASPSTPATLSPAGAKQKPPPTAGSPSSEDKDEASAKIAMTFLLFFSFFMLR